MTTTTTMILSGRHFPGILARVVPSFVVKIVEKINVEKRVK